MLAQKLNVEPLFAVVTIAEAAAMWQRRNETIRRAMNAKKKPLQGRKSLGTWLISVESLERRWGKAKLEFCNND